MRISKWLLTDQCTTISGDRR